MFQVNTKTLKNGLTLITIDLPYLDSVTTMVAVGAGSRYETKKINGIFHFLEHMFFKGSKKYPSAEELSIIIDGMGAISNASTYKEYTTYWIKSAAKHLELASDILASQIAESLLAEDEIEKEKGVIVEELRMYRDNPQRYVWDLYEMLQFGDQPLGWDIGGEEKTITKFIREDFLKLMDNLYAPDNTVLVYAGRLPSNIRRTAEKFFLNLPKRAISKFTPFKKIKQTKPRVNIFYKKTDQVHIVLGVAGFDRYSQDRYAARLLSVILGEDRSSRLFIEVREKRGLAYHVSADHYSYVDTGALVIYAGLKLEKNEEGLKVMVDEIARISNERVSQEELEKGKEMIRGRLAIRSESTNFLAEHFGTDFILDQKIETFEQYLKKIEAVTAQDVQKVARELFQTSKFNLQIIGPFKNSQPFLKILS